MPASFLQKTLSFVLLCFAVNIQAQDRYIFHPAEAATMYFTSVKTGSANFSLQNSTHLNIQYSFNSQSQNSFSLLYNYGTKTQDLSYHPKSFSLQYKGGNILTQINLQFWEDINRNGIFDTEDEVYKSDEMSLGAQDVNILNFDVKNFIKITGNGNGVLDLKRIRAFEIIVSNKNTLHNGTFEFVDLGLDFTSENTPQLTNHNINGTFIQLWNDVGCKCGNWTKQRWEEELQKMENLCIGELIIQYSVYENVSWYNQTQQSFVDWKFNALNHIFEAAVGKNIKIILGTYFSESWNHDPKNSQQTYDKISTKNEQIINELALNFGNHPNFGGWYIPQEINDLEWQINPQKNLLFNWLNETSTQIRAVSNQKIIIAPFFNLWQPADVILNWYKDLHSIAPNISEIALQDGVGIGLKKINYHLPLYFKPLQAYFESTNTHLGVTVENFEQTSGWPIDNAAFSAKSATVDRFKNQIEMAKYLALNPIYTFEWGYLQPANNSLSADQLYLNYAKATNCSPTSNSIITNKGLTILNHQILFDENQDVVKIYNVNGQLVDYSQNTTTFDYRHLKSGVYIVEYNQNQKLKLLK